MSTLDERGLRVRGTFVPIVAGEFEFWRHNPDHWPAILRAVREAGATMVSSFLCWDFHEIDRGEFDFTGDTNPMRDLRRFLRLADGEGLFVNLRPGPIIDSEWPTRGPSADVADLERTDLRFRARAEEWLSAVAPVIAEHEIEVGGPVAIIQLDNEVFYPHVTELSATEADSAFHIPYHEDQVLHDLETWLKDNPPAKLPGKTLPLTLLPAAGRLDAYRFLRDEVLSYLSWLEECLRASGVRSPCFTNVKQSCAYLDIRTLSGAISGGVGGNNYLDRLDSVEELLVSVWWNGVVRATATYPWAPEYWCGRWVEEGQDTSVFAPHHYEFCLLAQLAFGLRGVNYFSLVERDDWHYSPITAIGRVRDPLAEPVSNVNRVLRALRPDSHRANVALAWSLRSHQLFLSRRGFDWTELSSIWWEMDMPKEEPEWWETLRSLFLADVDFTLVSEDDPRLAEFPFIVAGGASVDEVSRRVPNAKVVEPAGKHMASILEAEGAKSFLRAEESGVFTALYDTRDGEQSYGFVVNWSQAYTRSRIESLVDLRSLRWLCAPAGWDSGTSTIELAPRSVAVFFS